MVENPKQRAKIYNKKVSKLLLKFGVPNTEARIIKKFDSKKEAIKYIRKNLSEYIPDLQLNDVKPFVDESSKGKSSYTKIIYTPMGNKR